MDRSNTISAREYVQRLQEIIDNPGNMSPELVEAFQGALDTENRLQSIMSRLMGAVTVKVPDPNRLKASIEINAEKFHQWGWEWDWSNTADGLSE